MLPGYTVKTHVYNPSDLIRICWQKFAILKPKNIRTCLAKQNEAGSKRIPVSGFQVNHSTLVIDPGLHIIHSVISYVRLNMLHL